MLDIMKSVYEKIKLPEKYSIETSIETINNSYKLTNKLIHDGNLQHNKFYFNTTTLSYSA